MYKMNNFIINSSRQATMDTIIDSALINPVQVSANDKVVEFIQRYNTKNIFNLDDFIEGIKTVKGDAITVITIVSGNSEEKSSREIPNKLEYIIKKIKSALTEEEYNKVKESIVEKYHLNESHGVISYTFITSTPVNGTEDFFNVEIKVPTIKYDTKSLVSSSPGLKLMTDVTIVIPPTVDDPNPEPVKEEDTKKSGLFGLKF